MLDPFPVPPPRLLVQTTTPLASALALPTLPLHIHELLFATLTYHLICAYVSPILSRRLFPNIYPNLPRRTRLNWDVHVVSLFQSIFVCAAALWVMAVDDERRHMDWKERIWGYTGGGGMIQAFAAGYFLWDLQICLRYFGVFGIGLLMHAVAALVVFSLGFRPFVNFYGPTFILYELSSPFLNFHWFFDKLQMTGSRAQWYNGILLLASFFCCRLLWGTYQSLRVYQDCWAALHVQNTTTLPSFITPAASTSNLPAHNNNPTGIPEMMQQATDNAGIMRFHPEPQDNIPTWLALTYLGSNVVLNTLNFYWFGKMMETVKKRFRAPPAKGKKEEEGEEEEEEEVPDVVVEGVELDGRVVEDGAPVGGEGTDGGVVGAQDKEETDGELRRRRRSEKS
ncbi:MAG: hypothetical protein LQ344_003727 [Seirophora lacunosa]|nr:MAG: hypothetical protein LQ344_003727 [Seirophora lacunosa]